MIKRICARCGIEFETNANAYYCQDCAPQHRAEAKQRSSREQWKNRNKPKGSGMTINDVIGLAPKYGLSKFDYGMAVSKIEIGRIKKNATDV